VYVNGQPELGFWKEAIKAVTTQVKARKQAIKAREKRKADERAAKLQAKTPASPLTAGFGGVSPWMLGAGAAALGAFLLLRRRRR